MKMKMKNDLSVLEGSCLFGSPLLLSFFHFLFSVSVSVSSSFNPFSLSLVSLSFYPFSLFLALFSLSLLFEKWVST
jgi:hypothetical protein